jgi:ribose/xylose/arabinose/galactoside ABC-type transport system permease subunit
MEKSTEVKLGLFKVDQHDLNLFMKRYGIGFVLLGMFLILSLASPKFLTVTNLSNILTTVSINGLLAMGMVFVITAGGIDLSIGSMLALGSVTIGLILNATGSIFLASLGAVAVCALFGLINGYLVAKFDMFPFVVTLASMLVIRGVAYVLSGGYSFALVKPEFAQIGLGKLFGKVPFPALILIIVSAIAMVLLQFTKYGRYVYAVGGNIKAATASGVNVMWTRVGTFVISGITAGTAAILMTARINAAQPNIGTGYEVDAIAACVIGGTSFSGGISTIPGTFIGVMIIGLIFNGMNLLGINSYWQIIMKGVLIIAAVMMDKLINRKK